MKSTTILSKMATSTVPTPTSYQQILGTQLNTVRARLGLRKFKPGGQLLTIFEAAAQADARISSSIFANLLSQNLDSSEGILLDRIGNDEDLPRRVKKPSRGSVTISDPSFQKMASMVYHGKPAPIVGSVSVYVTKGSSFDPSPSTGQIYLGRGTQNYEGPLVYSAKTDSGPYWTLTVSPTTKFHNQGETVILAQGGLRPIQVGQIVSTAQGAATAPVTFTTTQYNSIADGETQIDLVPIVCSVDGSVGNLPPESVVSFGNSAPFPTAQVNNPSEISFGRDVEQDNDYRDRIRQARANTQRGTAQAIKNAVIDLSSLDETSSVLSANVLIRKDRPTILCIDDGNGYEEKAAGIGFEAVVDSALGGETDFLSILSPIAQASVEATNQSPYIIPDGASLTIKVGGVASTHFFDATVFTSPLSASAFDIISSVNANSNLLFQGRLAQNTASVAFFAKTEENDDLEVILSPTPEMDAAVVLGLSTTKTYTTSLYKNDLALSKDGSFAQIASAPFVNWSPLIGTQSLQLRLDNGESYLYLITDVTFQALGYPGVSNADPSVWTQAFNNTLPGVTATVESGQVILTSNKGRSSLAAVSIEGGTLVANGVFAISISKGVSNDYSIDRAVGSIVINQQLSEGDRLSLGTQWAEAFIETDFGNGSFSLPANASYFTVVDDPAATIIPTSVFRGALYSSVAKDQSPSGTYFDLYSGGSPVTVNGLEEGDWVLLNDSAFDSIKPWKGIYRTSKDSIVNFKLDADTATRIGHTSTALTGSAVLVAGGLTSFQNGIGLPGAMKGRGVTGNCQLYSAVDGSWTQLPSMITPRAYHTATRLTNNKVFIAGGFDAAGNPTATTEIFDPATKIFTAGPPLPTSSSDPTPIPRAHHSATLLSSGMVLIAGGCNTAVLGSSALTSSFHYNPGSNSYQTYSDMNVARYGHQAVMDTSTTVVIFGGITTIASPATPLASIESYVDTIGTWTSRTPMTSGRAFFGACRLLGGSSDRIIVAGNGLRMNSDNSKVTSAAVRTSQNYNLALDSWSAEIAMDVTGAEFSQNDLACSNQTNTVIAFPVNTPTGTIKTDAYNTGTDSWGSYSPPFGVDLYITNQEATTSAALIGTGALGNDLAWFGGSILNSNPLQSLPTVQKSFGGVSNVNVVDPINNTKVNPYPIFTDLSLVDGRVIAVRSKYAPEKVTIPSNSGLFYTASSFAPVLTVASTDTEANVYKTNKVRLSTLSKDGSLFIVDQDNGLPTFTPDTNVISQLSQFASMVSNSDLDVPDGFQLRTISSKIKNSTGLPQSLILPDYSNDLGSSHLPEPLAPNSTIVGLKDYSYGSLANTLRPNQIFGNAKNQRAVIGTFSIPGSISETDTSTTASLGSYLGLRQEIPVSVGNPVYTAAPFKFAVNNTLEVTVANDDITNHFSVPMARKMATNGSYQTPLSLKDTDNSNNTISTAFGTNYTFDDFAIVSRARVLSDAGDATKRLLWRYYRYGEEGNAATVRYVYPTLPNQPVSVSVNSVQKQHDPSYYKGQPKVTVDVSIGSGVLRQNRNTTVNTRLGVAKATLAPVTNDTWNVYLCTGFQVFSGARSVLNGDTTLDIVYPYPASHGLHPGDVMWFEAAVPASSTLQTGQFAIKSIILVSNGHSQIFLDSHALNDGTIWGATANPGTISTDPNQMARFDDEILVNDLVSLKDPSGTITQDSMRVTSIGPTRQYLMCSAFNFNVTPVPDPVYSVLPALTDLQIFAPATNTASAIASFVNANLDNPVTATVTGTGAGVVSLANWDQYGAADSRYLLTDGINYVSNTNKPANTTLQTTFDLKLSISSGLQSNSDFANETFYLIPQFAESVVQWLNTPAITGLWSVSTITTNSNGTKIQIKSNTPGTTASILVEGGSANLATAAIVNQAVSSAFNPTLNHTAVLTTTKAEADGLCGNTWIEIDNTELVTKVSDASSNWGTFNNIASIGVDGKVTFTSPVYIPEPDTSISTIFNVEKIGKYVAYHFYKQAHTVDLTNSKEGNWLWVNASLPSNSGIFRILRFSQTETVFTYWVDNAKAIEMEADQGRTFVLTDSSPIPGDFLSINSNTFGSDNVGVWKIKDVGSNYTNSLVLSLDVSTRNPAAFTGTTATMVKDVSLVDQSPRHSVKKLISISPNSQNPNYSDLLIDDDAESAFWNQTNGTVVRSLSKLEFPNVVQTGTDAYRYNTGLIAEAKRVIYGDSSDTDNYPGYVSNGARVLIQGPIIKQVKMSLQVRLQSNTTAEDVIGNIKSAVAGVINASFIGTPIAISDIISAAQNVNGVLSISVISPTYNSVQDQISVRGSEKAMVIDSTNDIKVFVVGD